MKSPATTVDEYLAALPADRREAITAVLKTIRRHLPKGFVEVLNWGMICWQVPPEECPDNGSGQPLMYAALASQKQHMAIYLSSVYAVPALRRQLEEGYEHAGIRLDCGAGCVRFRKLHHVALPVIGKLIGALSMREFIAHSRAVEEEKRRLEGEKRRRPGKVAP